MSDRDTATATVDRFLAAVRDRDWGAALNNTLVSWVEGIPPEFEDRRYIASVLGGLHIDDFDVIAGHRIEHPTPSDASIMDVGFTITVDGRLFIGTARVSDGGGGRWGVSPLSILTRLVEAAAEA